MVMQAEDVREILSTIQLPTWYREVEWHTEPVHGFCFPPIVPAVQLDNFLFKRADMVDGPTARFRIEYMEPDVDTGALERQYARWWYVEPDWNAEAVIKTAWLALVVSDEHRRREAFSVNGQLIFEPHKKLDLVGDNVRIQRTNP